MIVFGRVLFILVFLLFFFLLSVVYIFFLQRMNAYFGYREINFDSYYFLWLLFCLVLSTPLISNKIRYPSDFYVFFHMLFIVMPFSFLSFSGVSEITWSLATFFVLIVFPVFLVKLLARVNVFPIRIPRVFNFNVACWLVVSIVFVLIFMAFWNAPQSAGFDYVTSYVRRLEGRESYPTGSFLAYSNSIVMNGFLPLIAFWSGMKRSVLLFGISVLGFVAFYYLIGVKAPFFYVAIAFFLGALVVSMRYRLVFVYFLSGLLVLMLISLFEVYFFEYSFLADYFFRRLFTVPPFLISVYSDFLYQSHGGEWSLLTGVDLDIPISMYVGENFMGHSDLNANTNTYVHAFASGGIVSYLFVCIVVALIFSIIDSQYRKHGDVNMLYCGFIFSLLLLEQYVTTILLTSGFFFVFLICLMMKVKSTNDKNS